MTNVVVKWNISYAPDEAAHERGMEEAARFIQVAVASQWRAEVLRRLKSTAQAYLSELEFAPLKNGVEVTLGSGAHDFSLGARVEAGMRGFDLRPGFSQKKARRYPISDRGAVKFVMLKYGGVVRRIPIDTGFPQGKKAWHHKGLAGVNILKHIEALFRGEIAEAAKDIYMRAVSAP